MNEYAYYSALAGLHYSVSSGASGIEISVDGYNDKLGILLKKVVERLKHLEIKPDRVEIHRNLLREALLNFYKVRLSLVEVYDGYEDLRIEET